jgi:hypothetical protein
VHWVLLSVESSCLIRSVVWCGCVYDILYHCWLVVQQGVWRTRRNASVSLPVYDLLIVAAMMSRSSPLLAHCCCLVASRSSFVVCAVLGGSIMLVL